MWSEHPAALFQQQVDTRIFPRPCLADRAGLEALDTGTGVAIPRLGNPRISSHLPHIDLAGDRGGDQGGAVYAHEVDGSAGFGDEGVDLC